MTCTNTRLNVNLIVKHFNSYYLYFVGKLVIVTIVLFPDNVICVDLKKIIMSTINSVLSLIGKDRIQVLAGLYQKLKL